MAYNDSDSSSSRIWICRIWISESLYGGAFHDSGYIGRKCVVNKIAYLVGSPDRYDIVAYRSVEHQDKYYSIKRVIGLPGETVLIQNGQVYINGNPLADSPIDSEIRTAGLAESSITLGENEYFLLGDNPDSSQDSRFSSVGNIKKSEMLGRIKE